MMLALMVFFWLLIAAFLALILWNLWVGVAIILVAVLAFVLRIDQIQRRRP